MVAMDTWREHFKIAAFAGILTGFLIQFPVDVMTKTGLGFPAIYQGLLMSGIFFFSLFIFLAIFLKIISALLKISYGKYLGCIYFIISFSTILTYYLIATSNFFFRKYLIFHSSLLADLSRFVLFLPSIAIFTTAFLITMFVLTKKREALLALFEKSRAVQFLKKIVLKRIVAILIFFICVALVVDAYSYFGDSTSNIPKESVPTGVPNVLFIVVDTVRADSTGFFGYPHNVTPFLDGLAKKSVVFENAITPSPRSMSTHASFFTGTRAGENSMFLRHRLLERDGETLAELMGKKGYATAGFISMPVLDKRSGLDRGFAIYESRHSFFEFRAYSEFDVLYALQNLPLVGQAIFRPLSETAADEVSDRAVSWLDENKGTPFFLFVHYAGSHSPYTPDKRTVQELNPNGTYTIDYSTRGIILDMARVQAISDNKLLYDAEIREADQGIEKVIAHLEKVGLLNTTVVAILADHGEEFYEHNGFFHGSTLYEEALHVPFIISYAKGFVPQRMKERINTVDLFSTILDLAGIIPPQDVDSKSLLPLINGESTSTEPMYGPVISETIKSTSAEGSEATNYLVTIYSGRWKLILAKEDENQNENALYDLEYDPWERNNLYDHDVEKREELKSLLFLNYKKSKAYLDSFPDLDFDDDDP